MYYLAEHTVGHGNENSGIQINGREPFLYTTADVNNVFGQGVAYGIDDLYSSDLSRKYLTVV